MHQSNLDKKAIKTIFAAVQIISNEQELKVISTDGQRYLESCIQDTFENMSLFINGVILYEIIKKSKSEFFQIKETFEANKILIDNAEFKFAKQTNESFPEWPDTYAHKVTISAKTLSYGLKTVKWASSNEEARPSLHGICLDFQETSLNLCATDCLKLAVYKIFDNYGFSGQWILGKKSVLELIKILEDYEGSSVELFLGKSIKLIANKNNSKTIWKTLVISAPFPSYEKLIQNNKNFPASFIGDSKEILETINRIMIVCNQHQHTIVFKFDKNGQSKIMAENSISEGEDILPGTYNGDTMKILFDGRFFQEMLNNINGTIILEIIDPISPIGVKQLENNGSLFVLAPIRPDL